LATVVGNYATGTALTTENTLTVQVNVTMVGSYDISTTAGGITFSKPGIFTATGIQTVVLAGTGTPTTAGTNTFTIGTAGCTFNVEVSGPAVYSFSGAPGTCTIANVAGVYSVSTTLSATNTVAVEVNVTSIGTFTISTTAGGMTFSKSGIFSTTGIQQVILNGAGTPTTVGVNTFTIGNAGCQFPVTVAVANAVFTCKIEGVFRSFSYNASAATRDELATPYLLLSGSFGPHSGNGVPELTFTIRKVDQGPVTVGIYDGDYTLSHNGGYLIGAIHQDVNTDLSIAKWINENTTLPPPALNNPPLNITITSITPTRVKGTFSGQVSGITGNNVPPLRTMTEGVFDLPIKP
jgi:hypothetical protein